MSKGKAVGLVFGCLIATFGLTVGGLFGWQQLKQFQASRSGTVDDGLQLASGAVNAINPVKTLAANDTKSDPLNDATSAATDGIASSVPKPTEFKQYEKYKDAKDALFGDIKVGTGNEIKAGSKVTILYKGWLTNGTIFDESKPTGPNGRLVGLQFTEGNHEVIAGMEQAIFGAKAGGVRRLIIPPAVGYGALGQGNIPGNSVLIFDVEIVTVE